MRVDCFQVISYKLCAHRKEDDKRTNKWQSQCDMKVIFARISNFLYTSSEAFLKQSGKRKRLPPLQMKKKVFLAEKMVWETFWNNIGRFSFPEGEI